MSADANSREVEEQRVATGSSAATEMPSASTGWSPGERLLVALVGALALAAVFGWAVLVALNG